MRAPLLPARALQGQEFEHAPDQTGRDDKQANKSGSVHHGVSGGSLDGEPCNVRAPCDKVVTVWNYDAPPCRACPPGAAAGMLPHLSAALYRAHP